MYNFRKQSISIIFLILLMGSSLVYWSCGSSSTSSGTSGSAVSGFSVPSEISAVPPAGGAGGSVVRSVNLSLASNLRALSRAATDPGTDYSQATTNRYVEEHALEQFDILKQVLNAINQTHYSDPINIGAGPYKCMVAWEEEMNGIEVKRLEPWVVRSDQIIEGGQFVLRAQAWIEEQEAGETTLIKAEFKVYEPATQGADGSYSDYGVWTMNVKFDDTGDDFFAASASVGANGEAVLKVHEIFSEEMPGSPIAFPMEVKAIMHRSDTEGYGQVYYPEWDMFWDPAFDPAAFALLTAEQKAAAVHETVKYAYNDDYVGVQPEGDPAMYKDRNTVYEMVHRYGVYDGTTGQDVMKTKSFGFPIVYTDGGLTKYAYYGAWQGRHQIWTQGGNDTVAQGTEVTREDTPFGEVPETYTVSKKFNGTLAKRTLVNADINDIKNIPVEIWINQDYNLIFDGANWNYCTDVNWGPPIGCNVALKDFDAEIGLDSLIVGPNDDRKWVGINRWDGEDKQYVYKKAGVEGAVTFPADGFYEAEWVNGRPTAKAGPILYVPAALDNMWVNVGGSIFVEYTGVGATGWVEKEVIGFNTMSWTPEFDDAGDKDYTLPLNKELYVNMQGANYIVTRTGPATYDTKVELQTAANPANATTVVPANTVFKDPWNPNVNSTYEFITDTADPNYLMLVYLSIGDNDKDANGDPKAGVAIGNVVENHIWGLEAYDGGVTATGTMYNWEYSNNGGWGTVTYLKNEDDSFKLLDDPMRFDAITAKNNADEDKTVALQYDGWMMGLPNLYEELMKNDWVMTDELNNKIINLPSGTAVTEVGSGDGYLLKPLQVSQFLKNVNLVDIPAGSEPDLTQADAVDLDSVPDYVEHGMGDMPDVTVVKYSEGVLVE